ncbi:MAG TPA: PhzF family phenazine biosynthesis protein, partial [Rhodothermales bacterium]|nr:PhzF family phenazine biosynthesis protein [Rhodothermales bacterium]
PSCNRFSILTELSFLQIDAFADRPFSGNPAVVYRPGDPLDAELMQRIAREMNVSETCFLVPSDEGFQLRWFTPTVEVDLCGHATLAAAHGLWTEWGHQGENICFQTLSGTLTAVSANDLIWLDFPLEPVEETPIPNEVAAALTVKPAYVGRNRLDYLAELGSEAAVRSISPDLAMLKKLPVRGLIVTARAHETKGADFVSRYFAPYFGIDEDPVTGSAHCALGPYWTERLGKQELLGYQASDRGGWVRVNVRGDRVDIGGKAVTVAQGTLRV